MRLPRITRLTVQSQEPVGPIPYEGPCEHEVTWYSTEDWIERCAICGETLGDVKWKPR